MKPLAVILLVFFVITVGCTHYPPYPSPPDQDANLVTESYQAADQLLAQAPWLQNRQQPVLVASFADINALEQSSAFGRMLAEQMGSRFAQQDVAVVELKMRHQVFIREFAGEFMLSRSVREISRSNNAAAVLVGTYAVGSDWIYVNARLIRATDNRLVAATDFRIPLGPDAQALLGESGGF